MNTWGWDNPKPFQLASGIQRRDALRDELWDPINKKPRKTFVEEEKYSNSDTTYSGQIFRAKYRDPANKKKCKTS